MSVLDLSGRTLPRKWGKLPHAWSSLSSSLKGVDGSRLKGKGNPLPRITSPDSMTWGLLPVLAFMQQGVPGPGTAGCCGKQVHPVYPSEMKEDTNKMHIHTVCKHPFYLRQGPHSIGTLNMCAHSTLADDCHCLRLHRHRGAHETSHQRLESGPPRGL